MILNEEPNTTQETDRTKIKWRAWIDESTPIPTPAAYERMDAVGLYEGAHYSFNGWYRPQQTCEMRELNREFCAVCREEMIKTFYRGVRPVESFTPANTSTLKLDPGASLYLEAKLMAPATHVLQAKWTIDGQPVNLANSSSLTLDSHLLTTVGSHFVTLEVWDPETAVRNDPPAADGSRLLAETITWTVDYGQLPTLPRITGVLNSASGSPGATADGLVTRYGENLALRTESYPGGLTLPTHLGGTTVLLGGYPCMLSYASPSQLNVVVPPNIPIGTISLSVMPDGQGSTSTSVPVHGLQPGLFTASEDGKGLAVGFAIDRTRTIPLVLGTGPVPITFPTDGSDLYISVFGTGWRNRSRLETIQVTIGGVTARATFAGAQPQFAGLDQLNILVPPALAGRGEVPLVVIADGVVAPIVALKFQ